MGTYLRADDIDAALAALASGGRSILAGGTDWYPARVGRDVAGETVLDIGALDGLRGITDDGAGWRIGALTTWSDLVATPLPACFDGYKAAAREVGGVQIQNTGTLAGNLCNASPAADGTPNLLALDACVELRSRRATRELAVADFVTGNRRTAREADELVTALRVPRLPAGARSVFLKLGARRYLVISIVMLAVVVVPDETGAVADARVAVGACSPVAQRLPALEAALRGRPLDARLAEQVDASHLAPLAAIDDVRASAAYRQDAVLTLLRRALADLGAGAAR